MLPRALIALACAGSLSGQVSPDTLAAKLDAGLADAKTPQPIFVRFHDQWLGSPAAYRAYCKKNRAAKRRPLRSLAIAGLKRRADATWKTFAPRLQAIADITRVQRYWVVNGFGCIASADACAKLAEDPGVAFVFRKPPRVRGLQRPASSDASLGPTEKTQAQAALRLLQAKSPFPALDALTTPFNVERIRAPAAWKSGAWGQGVTVALLDSGLLPTPALVRALWHNPGETLDGKDNDGNGLVDDLFGYDFDRDLGLTIGDARRCHGSMCGGIVAGRPVRVDGAWLCTGVAPKAQLMVLRGVGQLRAYEYALAMGADVLSMSFMFVNIELGHWRGLYRLAHEHMTAAGLVAVGGSGNFAQRAPAGKQICMPKDIPCVIAASGLDEENKLPPFSSLGPCTWDDVRFYRDFPPEQPLLKPDVTAFSMDFPVWSRLSAWPTTRRGVRHLHDAGQDCGLVIGPRGNSFAGPHAAGVAALMFSADPDLPAWRVQELMEASCRDLGAKGKDTSYGAGLLDAAAAVAQTRALRRQK